MPEPTLHALPMHDSAGLQGTSSWSQTTSIASNSRVPKELYLLTAVRQPAGRPACQPLHQDKLDNVATDRQLFIFLRSRVVDWARLGNIPLSKCVVDQIKVAHVSSARKSLNIVLLTGFSSP